MNPSEEITENYFLGDSDEELVRLRVQDSDLSEATADVISRLDIKPGSRILELACGPGFLTVNRFSKLIKVKKHMYVITTSTSPCLENHMPYCGPISHQ